MEGVVGRPTSYKEEYNEQAYNYCLLGATDAQLATFFNVCVATIHNWKNDFPDFLDSIKKGKEIADAKVARMLFERATGATIKTQQAVKLKDSQFNSEGRKVSEEERIEVVDLLQEVPPDTTAQIFWLKNRNPEMWRDKREFVGQDDEGSEVTINVVRVSKNKDAN